MKNQVSKIFIYKNNAQKKSLFSDLCTEIIKKNIPNSCEIIILDTKNIKKYINKNLLKKINKTQTQLSFDFLIFCVLYCNGGFFLKNDVLITKKSELFCELLSKFDLVCFENTLTKTSTNFLIANKNSNTLQKIICDKSNYNSTFEDIINKIQDNYPNNIITLDNEKSSYLMEKRVFGVTGKFTYQQCYFSNTISLLDFFENFKGIVLLNEKYTPKKYKNMPKNEFLNQDILISKIFNKLLE